MARSGEKAPSWLDAASENRMSWLGRIVKVPLLGAVVAYRFAISPLLGVNCRHLPSCSDYAREAIEKNGAWKGGWLTLARLCRCHPWGSHGFDPVPDLRNEHHPLAPWRYGQWRSRTGDEAPDSG
jgi:putative membrane protein insertion efficiency factor